VYTDRNDSFKSTKSGKHEAVFAAKAENGQLAWPYEFSDPAIEAEYKAGRVALLAEEVTLKSLTLQPPTNVVVVAKGLAEGQQLRNTVSADELFKGYGCCTTNKPLYSNPFEPGDVAFINKWGIAVLPETTEKVHTRVNTPMGPIVLTAKDQSLVLEKINEKRKAEKKPVLETHAQTGLVSIPGDEYDAHEPMVVGIQKQFFTPFKPEAFQVHVAPEATRDVSGKERPTSWCSPRMTLPEGKKAGDVLVNMGVEVVVTCRIVSTSAATAAPAQAVVSSPLATVKEPKGAAAAAAAASYGDPADPDDDGGY
jgi:hypothetical protein